MIDGYAFFNCTSLPKITIPDNVTEIAYSAFEGCSALTQITIPGSVTRITDNALARCPKVTIIAPAGSAAQAFAETNGISFSAL